MAKRKAPGSHVFRPQVAAPDGSSGAAASVSFTTPPDDFHHHVRDGPMLHTVMPFVAAQFARAIIMPNLKPPVTTVDIALAYRERILAALAGGGGGGGGAGAAAAAAQPGVAPFEPLMTLYLTDDTAPEEIAKARESGKVFAVKYYPAGATTNSASGVTDIAKVHGVLAALEAAGMPLLVHSEVTDCSVDTFDREAAFIAEVLAPTAAAFPGLKIVCEHITTAEAAAFVAASGPNVAATITAHHLLYNRTSLFQGGLRPHMYCLPVLKREAHRQALLRAIGSGSPKFFAGTDSAPHVAGNKESGCGCAGVFTAHAAVELYAEAFDEIGKLELLEGFLGHHGADFYGLPRNADKPFTLLRQEKAVPAAYPTAVGDELCDELVPLRAGETVAWTVART